MKKGFTLIEMLTVLSILALLALLIVPIIGKEMNKAKDELYQKQIQSIQHGAMNWGADHLENLPDVEGETFFLTLKTLQDGGYVKKNLKNPKTKKIFPSTLEIKIIFENNQYTYTVIDTSTNTITNS